MIVQKIKIKIKDKSTKQHFIDGRQITSRKVHALVEDDIFVFKFDDSTISIFDEIPKKGTVVVDLEITSPKEIARVDIVAVHGVDQKTP